MSGPTRNDFSGIKIKKGQDRNPAPSLNPISYEKPKCIIQFACQLQNTLRPGSGNVLRAFAMAENLHFIVYGSG
jgi:hypothetical protein